jgi:hypothetical protein
MHQLKTTELKNAKMNANEDLLNISINDIQIEDSFSHSMLYTKRMTSVKKKSQLVAWESKNKLPYISRYGNSPDLTTGYGKHRTSRRRQRSSRRLLRGKRGRKKTSTSGSRKNSILRNRKKAKRRKLKSRKAENPLNSKVFTD